MLATKLAPPSNESNVDAVIPTPKATKLTTYQLDLFKAIPAYSGRTDKSYELWRERVEGFAKTFNVDYGALEPHMSRILQGQALREYLALQKTKRNGKTGKYPTWEEVDILLRKMDDPVRRSLEVHQQIAEMRGRPMTTENVEYFRKLECQLDHAPLGDRVFLLFEVFPSAKEHIMPKLGEISSVDDACDVVIEALTKG